MQLSKFLTITLTLNSFYVNSKRKDSVNVVKADLLKAYVGECTEKWDAR